jgi:hypothetical protein
MLRLFAFIARFTCSIVLVCYVFDKVCCGENGGFFCKKFKGES